MEKNYRCLRTEPYWTDVYYCIYEHESVIAEGTGSLISCFQLRLAQLLPLSPEENKLKLMCEKKGRDARNVSAVMAKQIGWWNLSAAVSHCTSTHLDKKKYIVWVLKKQQGCEKQVKGEGCFQFMSLEARAIISVVLQVLLHHDSWSRVDDSSRVFVFGGFESQRILICPEDRINKETSTWKLLPVWKKYAATPMRL